MKTCVVCRQIKPFAEFYQHWRTADGYTSSCKSCSGKRGQKAISIKKRLERLSIPEPNSGCVIWIGRLNNKGYSQIMCRDGLHLAHRVAYELSKGPIPGGLELDHLCRNPACINPDHLEAVTRKVNQNRGRAAEATKERHRNKLFCDNCGGPLEFLYRSSRRSGQLQRGCRSCRRASGRAYDARRSPRRRLGGLL